MIIPESIKEALTFLSNIEYINKGGCGISALVIAKILEREGIEYHGFSIVCDDDEEFDINNNLVLDGQIDQVDIGHVGVNLDKNVIDCDGVIPNVFFISITKEELLWCINNQSWNHSFNREKYLPIIQKELNIDLKEVVYDPFA